jgi:hypothetical protein
LATIRRIWRYQRGNENPYIEEEQRTQWSKEKVQKDKQRSTKHTYTTKDWVTRTPLTIEGELSCSGRVSSSCSTSDTRRVNLVILNTTGLNLSSIWHALYCDVGQIGKLDWTFMHGRHSILYLLHVRKKENFSTNMFCLSRLIFLLDCQSYIQQYQPLLKFKSLINTVR